MLAVSSFSPSSSRAMNSRFVSRILRMDEIEARSGLCRASINRKWDAEGAYYDPTFAPKIQLGVRAVGVEEAALERWLAARTLASVER
ncbi:MAG: helix-turn-helix transcriptional regulator [Pseudomonadota bacterium]